MADDATKKVETKDPASIAPGSAPVLPLRDIVVFPHMIVPLFVGREKSVRALEEVMNDEKQILLSPRRMPPRTIPRPKACTPSAPWPPCCSCSKSPDQTVRVLVEGKARARVNGFSTRTDFFEADGRERFPRKPRQPRKPRR